MSIPSEPMSEDDCPDDVVVSLPPFELGGDKISINYIKEESKDFFRPINTQIEINVVPDNFYLSDEAVKKL